ncbi:hypothetical protein Pfo_014283, partial [Paulownia fortunei]
DWNLYICIFEFSPSCLSLWIQLLVLLFSPYTLATSFIDHSSTNVSTSFWLNHHTSNNGYWKFGDGTHVRTILALGRNGYPDFCFGFFQQWGCHYFQSCPSQTPNYRCFKLYF